MEEFVAPCEVTLLACNENHYFHTECIQGYIGFNQRQGKGSNCPLCRKVIEVPTNKKMMFKGVE
jgi:transcription initiation factor IIE alpha subunit